MTLQDIDVDAILRTGRTRRAWPWLLAGLATVAAAVAVFVLTRGSAAEVVTPPQEVRATAGQIITSVSLSGSATAPEFQNLFFGTAGTVASVGVRPGDTVQAGDVIARLETADLERAVQEADLTLTLRRQQYSELLLNPDDPATASKLASLDQSQTAATQRVTKAQEALDALLKPGADDVETAFALVLQRRQQLQQAQDALDALLAGPTADAIVNANAAITSAEQPLLTAAQQLALAITQVNAINLASYLGFPSDLSDIEVIDVLLSDPDPLLARETSLLSTTSLRTADAGYRVARANLIQARESLADLQTPPTADEVSAAQLAVEQARTALADAESTLDATTNRWTAAHLGQKPAVADDDAIIAARDELAVAQAALKGVQLDIAAQFSGPNASAVTSAQLAIVRAEADRAAARDALDGAVLRAPFSGTVEAVNVAAGDDVTATAAVVSLLNESNIEVDLVVTESELADVAVGQTGTATFDALPGAQYPVRVTQVSRVPSVSQGVTTYPVTAVLLTGPEAAAAQSATRGALGAFAGGGGAVGGQALERLGVVIPEGVDAAEVTRALMNGDPLPAGVTVPEGFTLPERLGQALEGGGAGPLAAGGTASATAAAPMPAPGMSASVTLITSVGDQAVLVAMSAVRQIDGAYYVRVPDASAVEGSRRVEVTIGKSDGTNVEVLSGLEDGSTVLVGVETEGVPLTVTGLQRNAQQQEGGFPGFFPGGGQFGGGAP